MKHYVIVGNSAAGIAAAEAIRQHNRSDTITVISQEEYHSYRRDLLADFIAGKKNERDLFYKDNNFFAANSINVLLQKKVVEIRVSKNALGIEEKDEKDNLKRSTIEYDVLLLAHGACAVVPDIKGVTKRGVVSLRTLADAKKILERLPVTLTACVMGADLTSLKCAYALSRRNIEVKLIISTDAIFPHLLDSQAAAIFEQKIKESGIELIRANDISEIIGNGDVKAVRLSTGKVIGCSLVVIGKGAEPNINLVKETGIVYEKGIIVDAAMHTNIPNIFAAGDVCQLKEYPYQICAIDASWEQSVEQGRVAGFNIAGGSARFQVATQQFSVECFDVPMIGLGQLACADQECRVVKKHEGSVYEKLLVKDSMILGALLVGGADKKDVYHDFIKNRTDASQIVGDFLAASGQDAEDDADAQEDDTKEGAVMSDLAKAIADTSQSVIALAKNALTELDVSQKIAYENTAYHLPLAYALLGKEIATAADAKAIVESAKQLWNNQEAAGGLSVPYADGLLNKGLATLLCVELITALNYAQGKASQEGCVGFIPDTVLRSLGLQLVDGRIAGVAVIIGRPAESAQAVEIIRGLQEKNIVSLLVGDVEGKTFADQLKEENVEVGLDNYIIPLGRDVLSAIYAVNFAIRAPLTFGGCSKGQWQKSLEYCQQRVPAFVLVLGKLDEVIATAGMGALAMGFPIITDMDAPAIGKIETTKYDALVVEKDYSKIVGKCIETRGIKIKVHKLDIPVMYGAAFEGERVRKENLYVQFGGKKAVAFELLKYGQMDNIEDGKVTIVGPDIDTIEEKSLPLGIVVEIGSRNANKDYEPIIERQIHRYINEAQGVMHLGQRDIVWIRISQDAFKKGFRLKHIGTILHAQIHDEYSAIVDKVQVTIYSNLSDVQRVLEEARAIYKERDERIGGMVDESVTEFYSCALCQSFAPNHICVITPERLGLCGAYSWLDAKANFQISPAGANQPIEKGDMLDERLGQWKNVNDFVYDKSNKTVEKVSMYSLLESPQTSCGCFECIVALVPEANGFMVVNRDYMGETPLGMTFTTLAGSVGGGVQTPGFLGIGRYYLTSRKFISAEGGLRRIVWMPSELKEFLREKLEIRSKEIGIPDFINMICDETKATTLEGLLEYLARVKHPAPEMPSLI